MIGWIKLTPAQATAITGLSATNPGNNFVAPVVDASDDKWLSADVLVEPLFAHYMPVLSTLTLTHENEPEWPVAPF